MKKIAIFLSFLVMSMSFLIAETQAQAPSSFLYQAEARDSRGKILDEEQLSIKATILHEEFEIYQETHKVQTDVNGLFNLKIGDGEAVVGDDFSSIDWSNGLYFLNIQIAVGVSENYTSMGTTQLLSVPYALHAKTVGSLEGNKSEIIDLVSGSHSHTVSQVLTEGNDAEGNQIENLGIPVNNQDAATKLYVDQLIHKIDALENILMQVDNDGDGISDYEDNCPSIFNPEQEDDDNDGVGNNCDPNYDPNTDWQVGQEWVDTRDFTSYKTVGIGNQIWMAENLAYLPSVGPSTDVSLIEPLYYVYDYFRYSVDEAKTKDNYKLYGVLYNWLASQDACPCGWHLPSNDEWEQLAQYISDTNGPFEKYESPVDEHYSIWREVGDYLKANSGWSDDGNGNGYYSFNALPGGKTESSFQGLESYGFWWTSSDVTPYSTYVRYIRNSASYFYQMDEARKDGYSIRCIKD